MASRGRRAASCHVMPVVLASLRKRRVLVISSPVMSRHAMSCPVISSCVLICRVKSCPVMLCNVMAGLAPHIVSLVSSITPCRLFLCYGMSSHLLYNLVLRPVVSSCVMSCKRLAVLVPLASCVVSFKC